MAPARHRQDLAVLGLLQLADSAFPSGAYTLSHGLETLIAERIVRDGDDLLGYVRSCLRHRMARTDLPAVLAAARAADLATLVAIDGRLDATKLAAEERAGSTRVGRRLLVEGGRLVESPLAADYGAAAAEGRSPGHAAPAFGVIGRSLGADDRACALAFASAFTIGLVAAAVRLSVVGHRDAQRVIHASSLDIAAAVGIAAAMDWRDMASSAPQHDIALSRHEVADVRLFAS